jgi:hypothetical protein
VIVSTHGTFTSELSLLWMDQNSKFHSYAHLQSLTWSWGSSVSIVSDYGLDWTTGVSSPPEAEDFSSSLCVQTGSGAHPASCPTGTGGKARQGRDADHSPPSSAEVKNE